MNKYQKQLIDLCSRKSKLKYHRFFYTPKSKLGEKLLQDAENIINNNKINFANYYDLEKCKGFIKSNPKKIDEEGNLIDDNIHNKIIELLKLSNSTLNIEKSSRDKEFIDVKENKYDDNFIPLETFNSFSFWLNAFKDSSIEYEFNKKIPNGMFDNTTTKIRSAKFKILSESEIISYPTHFETTCTGPVKINNKLDYNVECGEKIEFCEYHMSQKICCAAGHTLSNPRAVPSAENIELYSYVVVDLNSEQDNELLIYSLNPIDAGIIIGNYINIQYQNNQKIIILLNHKKIITHKKELKNNILLRDKKNHFFLNDMYISIQKYLKDVFNFTLTNQSKYLGEVILFQCILKLMFNIPTNAIFLGTSGIGKSFWYNMLVPLMTMKKTKLYGLSVRRTKFIGGESNKKTLFSNAIFAPGVVETKDFVFIEEAGNALEDLNINKDKENNIFTMLKAASEEIDPGNRSSRPVKLNASCYLAGNIEDASSVVDNYRRKVLRKYKENTMGEKSRVSYNLPLFKASKWYEEKKNIELAKAHEFVRYSEYNNKYYATNLSFAEQGRFDFCLLLEAESGDKGDDEYNPDEEKINVNFHREEFINECKNIFYEVDVETYVKIQQKVSELLNIKKNNYKVHNRFIIAQLKKRVFRLFRYLIICNRQYWEESCDLTKNPIRDDELLAAHNWMLYNYNSLDNNEISMVKTPLPNTMYYDLFQLKEETDDVIEKIKQQKNNENMSISFDELLGNKE